LAGLTQTDVAQSLGMSFQVVQKYEQGEIRISASRLFQLSALLHRPVDYFFDGYAGQSPADMQLLREEIELVRAYRVIQNPGLRQSIQRLLLDLSRAMSGEDQI
jgi:transcriptional regulator with XRE-family HTH domain